MMHLEDYLESNAKRYPHKTAMVCGQEQCTYKELHDRVVSRMEELRTSYPQKGHIVCLRAFSTIDYLVTYFALHQLGCVVTPLEQNIPEETFNKIAKEMEQHTVPEDTADILYTTGTTGLSKGVMISHRAIIADAENLIAGQGFSHDLAFVVNGPLNHIGSLSKIYPVVILGATLIIVDGMKDMNKFIEAFDYPSSKMATFLVPANIRILLLFCSERLALLKDKIDFIETGAAAISQADMEALCKLLPNSRLYNTYASTETGIICTYNYNDGRCIAGCLGKPMKHSQVIITDQGLIACKGETIMTGYVGDSERTSSVLKNGTVYTSDMGVLDEEGMLHLMGREDDVINVGGFKVAPLEVENAVLSYPGISDCVCIPVRHPITGSALKLLYVENEGISINKRQLALFLKSRIEPYKVPMLYEKVECVKRTFNGKIDRKFYINMSSKSSE